MSKKDMFNELLSAFGETDSKLFEEFGRAAQEFPNMCLLLVEFIRDSGKTMHEVNDLRHNVETLKNILLEAGVMRPVTKEEMVHEAVKKSDLTIDEISWLQNMPIDDGDLPN